MTDVSRQRRPHFRKAVALLSATVLAVTIGGSAAAATQSQATAQNPSTQAFNFDTGHAAFEVIYPAVGPRLREFIGAVAMDGTLVLRVSANMEGSWFDATAPYHPTAVGFYSDLGRRPASEATNRNINIAMLYSSYRVLNSLLPTYKQAWTDMLSSVGLDAGNASVDPASAIGLGNLGGNAWVKARENDGMNQLGNEGGQKYHGHPYADYTGYEPVNTAYHIKNPSRWQPQIVTTENGVFKVQNFVTPQLSVTKPISYPDVRVFTLPAPSKSNWQRNPREYKKQADVMLAASANLTEEQKLKAELFNDKLNFARSYPDLTRGKGLLEFVQQAAAVHIASFDGLLAAWYNKVKYDAVRPFTAITWVYGNRKVTAWGGPGKGTVTDMPANQWRSYFQTSDHAEYPSGTTTFCGAQMQVGKRWLGSNSMKASYTWQPGSSYVETGLVPAKTTTLSWDTWDNYLKDCVDSRTWAGVHFPAASQGGASIGTRIGDVTYEFVQAHIRGEHIRY